MFEFADTNNVQVSYAFAKNCREILHYTQTVLDVKCWRAAQVEVPGNVS